MWRSHPRKQEKGSGMRGNREEGPAGNSTSKPYEASRAGQTGSFFFIFFFP